MVQTAPHQPSTLALLEPEDQVLSTLNRDGSRRWLRPRLAPGRYLTARRWVGYVLMAVFLLIPHIRLNDKPLILLNIAAREFTFFGYTFLPTDTLLLALFMVGLIVSIFLVTALLGRVWCGWICPQTVYMEFLYRPLERLFDGAPKRGGQLAKPPQGWRTALKYVPFLICSAILANTFIAYFVGADAVAQWMRRSPFEHPVPFIVMAVTTGLMLFDFCFFREQTCILACPYGRLQSVMLDRDSLIISYDARRGEPRGPLRRTSATREAEAPARGDCIDCGMCVDTCPTGIDIRRGLQMECVGCAQCVDACDAIMAKIDKPRGLIRYSTQTRIAGQVGSILRPRVLLYPAILALIAVAFIVVLSGKEAADVTVLRGLGLPFSVLPDGNVANPTRVKIVNRTNALAAYTLAVEGRSDAQLVVAENPLTVEPGATRTEGLTIILPPTAYTGGHCEIELHITNTAGFDKRVRWRLLGPAATPAQSP